MPAVEYLPTGHSSGAVSPKQKYPGSHGVVLFVAPPAHFIPPLHAKQVAELVAPVDSEYIPPGHGVHVAELIAPVAAEYVPAGHCVHVIAPAGEYVPAGQIVSVLGVVHEYPARHR